MVAGLVARTAESETVREFLQRALTEPTVLVVEGEAGIGKTTLLLEATDSAAANGFRVLSASGAPTEVRYAYAAVADLLALVDTAVVEELPEAQQAALEHVLLGGGDGPASDERMVATAFLAVIRELSSVAPVLICIDDAQWLDASSQAVIGFAARRLTGRVGLLIAARTGGADSIDMTWLSPARPDSLARLRISPLLLGGVHAVVSARLGHTLPRPVITRIHAISGGNPFFALELARFIADDPDGAVDRLPDVLTALVRHNIGCPDDEVAAVLLAAACAAAPTVERVSLATDISPGRVVELLESEQAAGVIQVDGSRIRFRHPLFATGVYSSATATMRRAMHRQFAGIVKEPELMARHLALAATSCDPDTLKALDAAVEATVARGAPAVAAELLELAIKLGDDTPMRRMRAAEQHFRSGAVAPARAQFQSALDGLPAPNPLRCIALMSLAAVTGFDESLTAAVDLLNQAVDEAADNPFMQLRARLLLVSPLALIGKGEESVEQARIAVEQAEQLNIGSLRSQALALRTLSHFLYGLGVDHQALQTALDLEDPDGMTILAYEASSVEAVLRSWTGDLDVACTLLHGIQQRCLRGGTEIEILWAAHHVNMADLWAGRYAEAAVAAADAVQRAEQMGARYVLVEARIPQAEVAAYTGREQDARAAAGAALEGARAVGAVLLVHAAARVLAFLEVSLGDYSAALAVLEPLLALFDPERDTEIGVGGYLPDAVEALTALGRLDEAEVLIAALERNGARLDRPWMLAVGARGRSQWLAAGGDFAAAEQAAELALEYHERLPMPFERARTELFLGQVQRRRRRKQASHANLQSALETFERLGAPLWAGRARAELERSTKAGPGAGLTTAERRVAELGAAGLSNKQIAAELFIATKTVEMTLSSVYRKLGIRSRAALFAALNPGDRPGNVQGNP